MCCNPYGYILWQYGARSTVYCVGTQRKDDTPLVPQNAPIPTAPLLGPKPHPQNVKPQRSGETIRKAHSRAMYGVQ